MPKAAGNTTFARRARAYVDRVLWETDERSLQAGWRALLTIARLAFVTVEGFFREHLQIRAAALAFYTVLSIVPFAALTFSVAKSVGAYDVLVAETVRPFLADTFHAGSGEEVPEGVSALHGMLENMLDLVSGTNVFGLGAIGFVILLLTINRVVRGAEESFDRIWSSHTERTFWRRIPAYLWTAIVTPAALVFATTLTAARHTSIIERLIPVPLLSDLVGFVLPPLLVCLGILPMYLVLPSVRVRNRSAIIGAIVGGLGWYLLQVLHVRFQIGVARQNALYSGFGAFPIFLVWLHLSWVCILLGAQVAAAHQNAPTLRQLARPQLHDHVSRLAVGLRAMVAICEEPKGLKMRALAERLGVGVRALRPVLDALVEHRLLASSEGPYDPRFTASGDPDEVRVASVVDALNSRASFSELPWDDEERPLTEVLQGLQAAIESSDHNRTIGELRRATARRDG
jgi:membrane protein